MENVLDYITWEMAFTVVGLAFAIILGVSGFLINHLRNKKEWSGPLNELENELMKIQGEYEQLDSRVQDLKENLEKHDSRDSEDFRRLEGQIERLTDLVIKSLTQDK